MNGVMKKDLANKFVLASFSCQLFRAERLQRRESNKALLQVTPWGCLKGIVLIVN